MQSILTTYKHTMNSDYSGQLKKHVTVLDNVWDWLGILNNSWEPIYYTNTLPISSLYIYI